jgi:hypothetical protein
MKYPIGRNEIPHDKYDIPAMAGMKYPMTGMISQQWQE